MKTLFFYKKGFLLPLILNLLTSFQLLSMISNNSGVIFRIEHIKDLSILRITNQDLIVFDLDNVIFTLGISWLRKESFLDEIARGNSAAYAKFEELKAQNPVYILVEQDFLSVLRIMRFYEPMIIGLTERADNDPVLWKFLSRNQIYFTNNITLNFNPNGTVKCENGVIFCNGEDKGSVLMQFLSRMGIHPSRIIFIDDQLKHCYEVTEYCKQANIPCSSFHYSFISKSFNRNLAMFQYKYWLENGIILTDTQANLHLELPTNSQGSQTSSPLSSPERQESPPPPMPTQPPITNSSNCCVIALHQDLPVLTTSHNTDVAQSPSAQSYR